MQRFNIVAGTPVLDGHIGSWFASSRVKRNTLYEISKHVPHKPDSTTTKRWNLENVELHCPKALITTKPICAFVFASFKVEFSHDTVPMYLFI